MPRRLAFTVVTKDHLALARVLARSLRVHHPECDFAVVLADRVQGCFEPADELFELVLAADLGVPAFEEFKYWYSRLELCTALKPYALRYFLERGTHDEVLYFDADIELFAPLPHVFEPLATASIVLTPHITRPYRDAHEPSERTFLRVGVFNLGFLGVRAGADAERLCDWWCDKLHLQCVVDLAAGLFVDQKWMDLVPAYFERHHVVRAPGYNVAYWNLHEQRLGGAPGAVTVNGEPLRFFHFSGYSQDAPARFTDHSERWRLDDDPLLRALCDGHGAALAEAGHAAARRWPFAYGALPNGVPVSVGVSTSLRRAVAARLPHPSPELAPDDFARFLLERQPALTGCELTPYEHHLWEQRADLRQAFPEAPREPLRSGFRAWLQEHGVAEDAGLAALLRVAPLEPLRRQRVQEVFSRLDEHGRRDVYAAFSGLFTDDSRFAAFLAWVREHGRTELGLGEEHAAALERARGGFSAVLSSYLWRPDLQQAFPSLEEPATLAAFVAWLEREVGALELTLDESSFFRYFAREEAGLLAAIVRRYAPQAGALTEEAPGAGRVAGPAEPAEAVASGALPRVNFAGFLRTASGIGEAARSLLRALELACDVRPLVLPNAPHHGPSLPSTPDYLGWPAAGARTSVTAANADISLLARRFLPPAFRAERNIGFWAWETDRLPQRFARHHALYDALWAPSQYNADAITRSTGRPAQVVLLPLDFGALSGITADRARFGFGEEETVFGFCLDYRSVLERKNPLGLLEAFRRAFGERPRGVRLCFKVHQGDPAQRDYRAFREAALRAGAQLIEGTRPREETVTLLASFDVYVSLHRAEGFGFTCAEAMALGTPVIASAYSGNLDFMTPQTSRLIPCGETLTTVDHGPYPAGTRWAEPDLDAAAAAMRELLDVGVRARLAQAARAHVAAVLSPAAVAHTLAGLLG